MGKLYDSDIVAWAAQQAELLRARKFDQLDLDNIAEEIEDVGKSEKRELIHRISVLTAHLLKCQFQPQRKGNSWRNMIRIQRNRIGRLIKRMPSLRPMLDDAEFLEDVWDDALVIVHGQAPEVEVPSIPVWTVSQILDPQFLPFTA